MYDANTDMSRHLPPTDWLIANRKKKAEVMEMVFTIAFMKCLKTDQLGEAHDYAQSVFGPLVDVAIGSIEEAPRTSGSRTRGEFAL